MAHDAFKIPLRPNPSTLPNVFPTILHELEAGPLPKQTQKLFSFLSFFFFQESPGLIWSICAGVPGGRTWLSDSLLLLTRSNWERIKRWEPSLDAAFFSFPQAVLNKAIKVKLSQKPSGWLDPSYQSIRLTQVCVVWSFIYSLCADRIAGGLRYLDRDGVVAAFPISLTPPAQTSDDKVRNTSGKSI